jgi:hypothetical protein
VDGVEAGARGGCASFERLLGGYSAPAWKEPDAGRADKHQVEPRGRLLGGQLSPFAVTTAGRRLVYLERAKGFEPSTPTLARLCSTPELHPHP